MPELLSGIFAARLGFFEIMPDNLMGANISSVLLITGMSMVLHGHQITLRSNYDYIVLHFLIGSFFYFYIIAYDGIIHISESAIGLLIYLIYAFHLIGGEAEVEEARSSKYQEYPPTLSFLLMAIATVGIYFSAHFTINSLSFHCSDTSYA